MGYHNRLKTFLLKFPSHHPDLKCLPLNKDGLRELPVLASNRKEALLMRKYIIDEGFEG